jgi:hypothetical protein
MGCFLSKKKIENGLRKDTDRNNKSGKFENETLGKLIVNKWENLRFIHVIHCIDGGYETLKHLAGHAGIKVKEIITQAMILRLLLVTV